MRLSEFYKKAGKEQPKRKRLVFSGMDKKGDDFHLFPVPVIAFFNGDALFAVAVGIKWGFWSVGLWIIDIVKNKFADKYFRINK
jgi:hypothetical protein